MISIKMHSVENRFVTGPSNILSAGMCACVHFSAQIFFLQAVAVKGLSKKRDLFSRVDWGAVDGAYPVSG